MADAMKSFIVDQNIMRYKMLLQRETHPDKRRILLQLLADEAEKLPEPIKRAEMLRTNRDFNHLIIFVSMVEHPPSLSDTTVLDDTGAAVCGSRRPHSIQKRDRQHPRRLQGVHHGAGSDLQC